MTDSNEIVEKLLQRNRKARHKPDTCMQHKRNRDITKDVVGNTLKRDTLRKAKEDS